MRWPLGFVFRFASSSSNFNMDQLFTQFLLLCILTVTYAGGNISKRDVENVGRRCQTGETWREDCNKCYCGNKGVPICTQWLCVGPPENTITSFHDDYCTPFSRWKEDCNVCFCTTEGLPKCTDYDCGPKKSFRVKRYIPTFSKDSRKTEQSLHTMYHKQKPFCQPGFSWFVGCYRYNCLESGLPSILKICPSENTHPEMKIRVCHEGDIWRINKLKCICQDGTGICKSYREKREVSSYNREKTVDTNLYEKACQPGFIWDDGCNSFACTDDGYYASSLNICSDENIIPDVRMCAEGSMWNFGNRKCHCTDKGFGRCVQTGSKKRTRVRNHNNHQDIWQRLVSSM